jgi:hypothetical protein
MIRALVTQVQDDRQVTLVFDEGGQQREMLVPIDQLPSDVKQGDYLDIELAGSRLVDAHHEGEDRHY